MKKAKSILNVICVLALLFAVTACGGKSNNTSDTTPTPDATQTPTQEDNAFDLASVDYSNPTVVVELDDVIGMEKLMKDAVNMKIEQGTVVKVTGKISTTPKTISLMAKRDDGSSIGIAITVEGDWTAPQDGTVAEAVGVMVKGQYFMEFHVLSGNIKV